MRITRRQLRQIIQEELGRITEDPDGLVPDDPVGQAASQSALRQAGQALDDREPYSPFNLITFMTKLDRDQQPYTGKSLMDDGSIKSALETDDPYFTNNFYKVDVLVNKWSGFWKKPPRPFPKASPNVVGQKFAGFARVNPGVFDGDLDERLYLVAKFFSDHKADPDLT
jgi:hypothetical protein